MKKWEEQNRLKNYQRKIQSAKPTLRMRPSSGVQPAPQLQASQHSLLPLLKQFNLQQYFRKLRERGFDHNLRALSSLTPREVGCLMEQISVLPGHLTNFQRLLKLLEEIDSAAPMASKTQLLRPVSGISSVQSPPRYLSQQLDFPSVSTQAGKSEEASLREQLEAAKQMIADLESQLSLASPIQLNRKIPVEISRDSFFKTPLAFQECRHPGQPSACVGKSIDSSKLRSTLVNIDIEETCRCFARALEQHIEDSEQAPHSVHNVRKKLAEVFIEEPTDPSDAYNFVRNLVTRGQLESQVPILALTYIDRLVAKSGIRLYRVNWKRLVFVSFMEASKVWDDESFENQSFAMAFTRFDITEINRMEAAFLTLLDYEMRVTSSDFAKSYFVLRSYAHNKDASMPLEAMDVQAAMRMQKKSEELAVVVQKLNMSL